MRFTVVAAGILAAVASAQSDASTVTDVAPTGDSSATGSVPDVTSAVESAVSSILSTGTADQSADQPASTGATGSTGSVPSVTVSIDPAQSSAQSAILDCLNACDASDVNCQAKCIAVPSPDSQNVNKTTECVAECPQGKGSASDNEAYADCVNGCIAQYFYTATGTSGPSATTGSGSSGTTSATPTVTQVKSTVTSDGSTFVTSFSTTVAPAASDNADSSSAAPSSTSSGGADMLFTPIGSGVGLFSFLAAFLAL
ncbi:hypothetical protein F5Y11DRAFT_86263 [Daldinia sp. FL1419]|nr:hypothetical protein F5Y11DRAFT_86263 [Daldinia sp. FL1419]